MNNLAALMPENHVLTAGLNELVGLVGLSPRSKSSELSISVGETFKAIGSFVNELVIKAIDAQTESQFDSLRAALFDSYARALRSQAELARLLVEEPIISKLVSESLCELESDLRESALCCFGQAVRDQAMFTVWTFRRISGIISRIAGSTNTLSGAAQKQDHDLAKEFSFYAMWSQFHLDCLVMSMRKDRPIRLEILPVIVEGLRAAVNAYSLARQGLILRSTESEVIVPRNEWDEEDSELLSSSMEDMKVMDVEPIETA